MVDTVDHSTTHPCRDSSIYMVCEYAYPYANRGRDGARLNITSRKGAEHEEAQQYEQSTYSNGSSILQFLETE